MGIALGYYFGRNRKLALATAVAVGGLAGGLRPKGLLGKGLKSLGSPELEELAGKLQTDIMEAGRAAATAATNGPINQLSDRIHDKAERLRDPLGTKDVHEDRREDRREDLHRGGRMTDTKTATPARQTRQGTRRHARRGRQARRPQADRQGDRNQLKDKVGDLTDRLTNYATGEKGGLSGPGPGRLEGDSKGP